MTSIYLQILRLGVDLAHYLVTSKCICLTSGLAAIWLHLLTKVTYYNSQTLLKSPFRLIVTLLTFVTAFAMIVIKVRLDLLMSLVIGIIDIAFMEGGTIKYPKDVFQEKEDWASAIKLNRLPLW